jgi:post-segregation antitoxin (ccd killing protein)
MRGGRRTPGPGKQLGRPEGSTKGRVKKNITVSCDNAAWLTRKKNQGFNVSALIDKALRMYRESLTTEK